MTKAQGPKEHAPRLRAWLLEWYRRNRRDLPWRRTRDPYAIWVSEIMLQQTRVAVVIGPYEAFLKRFPTVKALAEAPEQAVLALWSGLGYYRRARMLHQGAKYVVERLGGQVPDSALKLRELPGIGGYTSAAVASIAFNEPVAVVDGNVERVICRLAGWAADRTAVRRRAVERLAAELLDPESPGDFNQGMMELGATICLPRGPLCLSCPLVEGCRTRGEHPKPVRAPMTTRHAAVALCLRKRRGTPEVLLEQRPASESVMPGMWELPELGSEHGAKREPTMLVRHAIMQVNYIVQVYEPAEFQVVALMNGGTQRKWIPVDDAGSMALTGLARKILVRAQLLTPAQGAPA